MKNTRLLTLALLCTALSAMSQQVYRCEANGKVTYSHEPCLGAKAIDTTPTQSTDKTSAQHKKDMDALKAELDRSNAANVRPLASKAPDDPEVAKRRENLTPLAKHSCSLLDQALPQLRQNAAQGSTEEKTKAIAQLHKARKAFQDLRC